MRAVPPHLLQARPVPQPEPFQGSDSPEDPTPESPPLSQATLAILDPLSAADIAAIATAIGAEKTDAPIQRLVEAHSPPAKPPRKSAAERVGRGMLKMTDLEELFSVNETTIRRWVRRGIIPAPVKFGHTARWRAADLEAIAPDLFGSAESGWGKS